MAGWRDKKTPRFGDRPTRPRDPAPARTESPKAAESAGRRPRAAQLRTGGNGTPVRTNLVWVFRLMSLLIAAALLAAWIQWVFYRPVALPILVCAVNYDHQDLYIPPNAYASRDAGGLIDLTRKGRNFRALPSPFSSINRLLSDLQDDQIPAGLSQLLGGGGPSRSALVVYLSAHGVVNSAGEPCLLDADSDPLDEATWLPVSKIVTFLEDKEQISPRVRHIVLLLDSGRLEVNWSLGLLDPVFPEKLQETWKSLSPQRCWLVHSRSTASERNWAAPELGGSVFGHFVTEALGGAANRDRNGQLSLFELEEYLGAQVTNWTRTYRAASQHVQLLKPQSAREPVDFPLAWATPAAQAAPSRSAASQAGDDKAAGTPGATPVDATVSQADVNNLAGASQVAGVGNLADVDSIVRLWQRHFELFRQHRPWRFQPTRWSEFEHRLLEIEDYWLAGPDEAERLQRAIAEAHALADELQKPVAKTALDAVPTLSVRPWLTVRADPTLTAAAVAPSTGAAAGEKPVAAPPAWDRFFRELDQRHAFDRDDLQRRLVALSVTPPTAQAVEPAFAALLGQYVDWTTAREPIEALLRLRHQAESVAGLPDLRAFSTALQRINLADLERRSLEDKAFIGSADDWQQLAVKIPEVQNQYEAAQERARKWLDQMQLRDQMLVELPWLLQWAEAINAPLDEFLHPWNRLIEHQAELIRGEPVPDVDWHETQASFLKVHRQYEEACARLTDAGRDATYVRDVLQVLQVPIVSGNRGELLRGLARKLQEPSAGVVTGAIDSVNLADAAEAAPTVATSGPHVIATLLRAEAPERTDLWPDRLKLGERLRQQFSVRPGAERPFGDFTTDVQSFLLRTPPLRSSDDNRLQAEKFSELEWRGRALAIIAPRRTRLLEELIRQSTEFNLGQIGLWQAERHLRDFYGPLKPDGPAVSLEFAAQWLPLAQRVKALQGQVQQIRESLKLLATATRPLLLASLKPETGLSFRDSDELQSAQLAVVGMPIPAGVLDDFHPRGVAAAWLTADGQQPLSGYQPAPQSRRIPVVATNGIGWTSSASISGDGRRQLGQFDWQLSRTQLFPQSRPDQPADSTRTVTGHVVFRGHHATARLGVQAITEAGIERNFLRPVPVRTASVQVNGDASRHLWLMVVLDCSSSMRQPIEVPSEALGKTDGASETTVTRFELARLRLTEMLRDLATADQAGSMHVGLMAYGSQAAAVSGNQVRFLQPDGTIGNSRPKGSDVHPATDVRLWISPDREGSLQDPRRLDELTRRISDLKSIGSTPLYLSIRQAVEQLGTVGEPQDQKIVLVITDGVNNQEPGLKGYWKNFGGLPEPLERDLVSKSQLEEFLKSAARQVEVRIVGFALKRPEEYRRDAREQRQKATADNVSAEDSRRWLAEARALEDDATSMEELELLCRDSSGRDREGRRLRYSEGAAVLAEELKNLVPPVTFSVIPQAAVSTTGVPGYPLGQAMIFNPEVRLPGWFRVAVSGKNPAETSIEVLGGEQLLMTYREVNRQLIYTRYPQAGEESRVGEPCETEDWWASALPPRRPRESAGTMQFRVTVQPKEHTIFPARPRRVLAVIQPLDAGRHPLPGPPYIFFPDEVGCQPGLRAPVLQFNALDWPATAVFGRLELWFHPAGERAESDALAGFQEPLEKWLGKTLVEPGGLAGVQIKVDKLESDSQRNTRQLTVWQELSGEAPNAMDLPPPLWIRVEPQPAEWSRTVYPQSQRIRHRLHLDRLSQEDYVLKITTMSELQRGAIRLEFPEIQVPQ